MLRGARACERERLSEVLDSATRVIARRRERRTVRWEPAVPTAAAPSSLPSDGASVPVRHVLTSAGPGLLALPS